MKTVIEGIEDTEIIYTGSARVWRKSKSEMGERRCLSLETKGSSLVKKFINIKSAGEYRVYEFNINDIDKKLNQLSKNWNKNDVVTINLYGIIEDENELEKKINEISDNYVKKIRDLNVKYSNIFLLENADNENIIKEFFSIAEEYEFDTNTEEDLEIVELAKRIGIEKLFAALSSKKK